MYLSQSLLHHARVSPDQPAVRTDDAVLDFAGLARLIVVLGRAFAEDGERRVALCMGNTTTHFAAVFAAAAVGVELVELDPESLPEDLAGATATFGAATVYFDRVTRDTAAAVGGAGVRVRVIDEVDDPSLGLDDLRALGHADARDPEGIHVLSPSGGTSGRRKAILISHRATVQRILTQLVDFGIPHAGGYLAATPLHHGGARSLSLGYLYTGGHVHLADGFDTSTFLTQTRTTHAAFVVPTMLQRLVRHPGARPPEHFKMICAGSRLDPALLETAHDRLGCQIFDYYASVDTGPIAIRRPEERELPPGCVSHPAFGVDVLIEDPDEQGIGTICVAGATIACGYLGDAVERVKQGPDGRPRIRLNDRGYLDAAGRLFILGRSDDMIITGGVNVAPAEIEEAIARLPYVEAVAVIGLPDEEWGQKVTAVICPTPGEPPPSAQTVHSDLKAFLAGPRRPKHVLFTDELPLTDLGKLDRKAIVRCALEDAL